MTMQNELFELPRYEQISTRYDREFHTLWVYLDAFPRPCFTPTLLRELRDVQERVIRITKQYGEPRYFVLASAHPEAFSLGGDLDLFQRIIRDQDRDALQAYAERCIDCVYGFHSELRAAGVTTIALVQSRALGGGFEAALACNVLIAERRAKLGFPEIVFNLFPGMGAASFLERRIGAHGAQRLLTEGSPLPASSLNEMGLIDVLVEDGEGERAVYEYVRRAEPRRRGLDAIWNVTEGLHPVPRSELQRVVDFWVDRAMGVGNAELQTMTRLVAAQARLAKPSPVASSTWPAVPHPAGEVRP